jgi:hypothetical protein
MPLGWFLSKRIPGERIFNTVLGAFSGAAFGTMLRNDASVSVHGVEIIRNASVLLALILTIFWMRLCATYFAEGRYMAGLIAASPFLLLLLFLLALAGPLPVSFFGVLVGATAWSIGYLLLGIVAPLLKGRR